MPPDKQSRGTTPKPFTPTLSTAFRNSKSPLTPKLAGSKNASPVSPPHRASRSETAPPPSRREDFRSTTNSNLNGNVTPRSGARVSRIGGGSPATPGSNGRGTPSRTRPLSAIELSKPYQGSGTGAGLHISAPENKLSTASVGSNVASGHVVSGGLQRRISTGGQQNAAAESISPRFFQANDAQHYSSSELEETPDTRKPATFFYASDAGRRSNSPEGLRSTSGLSMEQGRQDKFGFANDRPTDRPSIPRTRQVGGKADPDAPLFPQSPSHKNQGVMQVQQQPSSPTKGGSMQSAPAACSSSTGTFNSGVLDSSHKPKTPRTPPDSPRRASTSSKTSTVRETAQRRPSYVDSAPSTPPRRPDLHISPKAIRTQNGPRQTAIPVSPIERFSPRSTSLSSTNTGVSAQSLDTTPSTSIHPLSPIKGETSQSAPIHRTNELAANARRERKVLDLEISNSSLLAINRTLESEMRKQSVELRRFRRLSRSGRLSMASTSTRSASGLSAVTESEDGDGIHSSLSDLEEEMSNSECDEEDPDSSFDDDSSSLLSPTSRADYDSRHRARDEKRLMLDLSKHQQLLIDSQKMNQSIRRCLGWTEELISEGKKALEYHVKVSDVELGGRVLADDHDHNDGESVGVGGVSSSKALLSPSLPTTISAEVDRGRRLWMQGLEEMEMEVDKMLESSTTLKEEIPALS